jgi:hypothetical protein
LIAARRIKTFSFSWPDPPIFRKLPREGGYSIPRPSG